MHNNKIQKNKELQNVKKKKIFLKGLCKCLGMLPRPDLYYDPLHPLSKKQKTNFWGVGLQVESGCVQHHNMNKYYQNYITYINVRTIYVFDERQRVMLHTIRRQQAIKVAYTCGKLSVNASLLHKTQEIHPCTETNLWNCQLMSLCCYSTILWKCIHIVCIHSNVDKEYPLMIDFRFEFLFTVSWKT